MSTQDKLRSIAAQKKELNEEQKVLRAQIDSNKAERNAARKAQAQARKDVQALKADLRDISAKSYTTFSKGTSEDVTCMADDITETAAELVTAIRSFAKAAETLENI